jgi:hypothetical protein
MKKKLKENELKITELYVKANQKPNKNDYNNQIFYRMEHFLKNLSHLPIIRIEKIKNKINLIKKVGQGSTSSVFIMKKNFSQIPFIAKIIYFRIIKSFEIQNKIKVRD